jgi:hypothetical protein
VSSEPKGLMTRMANHFIISLSFNHELCSPGSKTRLQTLHTERGA